MLNETYFKIKICYHYKCMPYLGSPDVVHSAIAFCD